jgi:hypothetical protein
MTPRRMMQIAMVLMAMNVAGILWVLALHALGRL